LARCRRILTVDIAETTSFALLCVVQSAGPVDRDIALPAVQTRRTLHGASRADSAKLEQAVKHRTIVADIVLALLLSKAVHVVGRDLVQELDVLVGVELRHFVLGGRFGALVSYQSWIQEQWEMLAYVDFHLGVEAVVHDQAMRHPYAMGLHGMASYVSIVAHVGVVEVGHFLRACPRALCKTVVRRRGGHVVVGHLVQLHLGVEARFANLKVGLRKPAGPGMEKAAAIVMRGTRGGSARIKRQRVPMRRDGGNKAPGASASFNRGGRHPC
jgi:hypothetical protein